MGAGIARVLDAQGAHVIVTGLTEQEGANSDYEAHIFDVRETNAGTRLLEGLANLDVLAGNEGVYPQSPIVDMSDEDVDFISNIDVKGTIQMVKAATTLLVASRSSRVIITPSITGNYTGHPKWAHYSATKAAHMSFMHSVAFELAPQSITVNAVLPGSILPPDSMQSVRNISPT